MAGMKSKRPRIFNKLALHFSWPAVFFPVLLLLLSSCAPYPPAPAYVPAPSTFHRAWGAALGGEQDEGVRITVADRSNGAIRRTRGEQEVTINMRTPADDDVASRFLRGDPKGPTLDWPAR